MLFICLFSEAVADATKAIQLDPSMSKAYFRKGLLSSFVIGIP
jgi:hypothetical protein